MAQQLVLADWVFAYGSLVWNPEFSCEEHQIGKVHGLHRAFCLRSTRFRGTPERPGVVLGLDYGGSCIGLVYRIAQHERETVIARLYEREMTGNIYCPRTVLVHLKDGRQVQALTFVANRSHEAYERLAEVDLIPRLRECQGQRGLNREYLLNTEASLRVHGVVDRYLERLVQVVMGGPAATT